jgi:hypothetical protein
MGKAEFTVALAVGAFLLASWVEARIGDSRPESPTRRSVHVLLSLVVLKLAVVLVAVVHGSGAPKVSVLIAVMVFFLPALVYAFLTGLWMMRTLAEVSGLARR